MANGALEVLKWLALLLMTGDHINTALFGRSVDWLYGVGRLVMPLFACVLAYNLARPQDAAVFRRTAVRMVLVGVLAQPFYMVSFHQGPFVLNIMFAFAVAVALMWWWQERNGSAWALASVLVVSGLFTEFAGTAQLLTFAFWLWWRPDNAPRSVDRRWALGLVLAALGLVCWVNGNGWALVSLPLVGIVGTYVQRGLPRYRWAFYGYYVAHLGVLAVVVLTGVVR